MTTLGGAWLADAALPAKDGTATAIAATIAPRNLIAVCLLTRTESAHCYGRTTELPEIQGFG